MTIKFFNCESGIKNPITSSLGTSVSLLTWISYSFKESFNFSCNATSNLDLVSVSSPPVLGSNWILIPNLVGFLFTPVLRLNLVLSAVTVVASLSSSLIIFFISCQLITFYIFRL